MAYSPMVQRMMDRQNPTQPVAPPTPTPPPPAYKAQERNYTQPMPQPPVQQQPMVGTPQPMHLGNSGQQPPSQADYQQQTQASILQGQQDWDAMSAEQLAQAQGSGGQRPDASMVQPYDQMMNNYNTATTNQQNLGFGAPPPAPTGGMYEQLQPPPAQTDYQQQIADSGGALSWLGQQAQQPPIEQQRAIASVGMPQPPTQQLPTPREGYSPYAGERLPMPAQQPSAFSGPLGMYGADGIGGRNDGLGGQGRGGGKGGGNSTPTNRYGSPPAQYGGGMPGSQQPSSAGGKGGGQQPASNYGSGSGKGG
jgi:hypothetical protein